MLSRERHYARLFHEQRTRDEAMRMEERMATASDETLPAMRAAMDRVDDKVECMNDKVECVDDKVDQMTAAISAMAHEMTLLRRHIRANKPVQKDSAPADTASPPSDANKPVKRDSAAADTAPPPTVSYQFASHLMRHRTSSQSKGGDEKLNEKHSSDAAGISTSSSGRRASRRTSSSGRHGRMSAGINSTTAPSHAVPLEACVSPVASSAERNGAAGSSTSDVRAWVAKQLANSASLEQLAREAASSTKSRMVNGKVGGGDPLQVVSKGDVPGHHSITGCC
jgi:hypothetical protein